MTKKECNCCCKIIKQPVKCFINKSCDWISCPSCINKQIKIKDDYDIFYCCPNCRTESIYNKHSKITKYCKTNRGTLNQIIKLQRLMLIKQNEKITNIHQIVSEPIGVYVNLTGDIVDIGGNEINEDEMLDYIQFNHVVDTPASVSALQESVLSQD